MQALITALRRAAAAEILPRFRRLAAGDVSAKTGFADLVTVADTAAEAHVAALLAESQPGLRVLGEEAVSADPGLRAAMAGPGEVVILDPIDGTWNFAHGLPLFGMIAARAQDGVVTGGVLYDPISGDWIVAEAGGPARLQSDGGPGRVLQVAGPRPVPEWTGYFPAGLFPRDLARAGVLAGLGYGRLLSLRASVHEYRMLVQGHADFVLSGPEPHPWDHAAGVLACQAAGGVARFLDGAPYDLARRHGVLLSAASEAVWQRVAADFAALA